MRYLRLNVEDGIGQMKLDEWRARGPIRTKIVLRVEKMRSSQGTTSVKAEGKTSAVNDCAGMDDESIGSPTAAIHHASDENGHAVGYERPTQFESSATLQAKKSMIPRFLGQRTKSSIQYASTQSHI